jgi:hypothetical protein
VDWLSSGRGSGGMREVREEPLRLNSGLRVWLGIGRDTKVFYSSLCSTLFALQGDASSTARCVPHCLLCKVTRPRSPKHGVGESVVYVRTQTHLRGGLRTRMEKQRWTPW